MDTGRHLLIVDDEDDFRESLTFLLNFEGFRVSDAATGGAALSLIEHGLRPDLVLLDYRMPGLTGAETLAQLRARGCGAPAVLVSAAKEAPDIAKRHGFDGVVMKPFSPDELLDAVRGLLAGPANP